MSMQPNDDFAIPAETARIARPTRVRKTMYWRNARHAAVVTRMIPWRFVTVTPASTPAVASQTVPVMPELNGV